MMNVPHISILISLFLIGISLSMDTFSVSLSLGTLNINKKKLILLPFIVGIMHFFMPLIGNAFGHKIINFLNIDSNFLLGLILLFISIEMILELIKKDNKYVELNFISMIIVGISVSIDSLSTGFGLQAITSNVLMAGAIFSICSASFTFMGLLIGKYSQEKLGFYSTFLGIALLIILGIFYIIK